MTKPKKTDKQTIKALRSALEDMRRERDLEIEKNTQLEKQVAHLKEVLSERADCIKEWNDEWKKEQAKRQALSNMLAIIRITTKHAENILEQ